MAGSAEDVAMQGVRVAVVMVMLMANSFGWGQQRGSAQTPTTDQSKPLSVSEGGDPAKEVSRTSKQKLLDDQAQRLVTMANELKAAVDKTNKNILSLDVVRKAEEIESLARKMKDQEKK